MSLESLMLAYRAKLLALRSAKRERYWWAAKAEEYNGLSAFMECSRGHSLDSNFYGIGTDSGMDNQSGLPSNSVIDEDQEAGSDDDAGNMECGFFQEVVRQYSRGATEGGEDEQAAQDHFYGTKTTQYQSYATFMTESDKSLDDSLKAIKMQLGILKLHIKAKSPTRDIMRKLEDLQLAYDLDAEDTPSESSDHSKDEGSSSSSEGEVVYVVSKWYIFIIQLASLLISFVLERCFQAIPSSCISGFISPTVRGYIFINTVTFCIPLFCVCLTSTNAGSVMWFSFSTLAQYMFFCTQDTQYLLLRLLKIQAG